MKTINLDPHTVTVVPHSKGFTMIVLGTTPGGKELRVRIACDGNGWVAEFANGLHGVLARREADLAEEKTAMKGSL